ncbi:LysR family substrate-binding domain-containing protein [Microbacterium amylolyticum]|uniref:DNA-binding transcriptional LysR family regulator n=1 Tax=Microbacterium amylolyticum TaxID=936337 RepID=A0ABS4ZHN1_9MICO|nr:LysR family substrate-binding domain-containing protein [Microbacterium amylolyticum]MBP2436563.1 DNA-binding transcriptional LysR family regulator [Microbacterium amylolyticum]
MTKPATKAKAPQKAQQKAPRPARLEPFRLGTIPGAMPGKWVSRWKQQRPQQRIELIPLDVPEQERALRDGTVDAAICRMPLGGDDLHVIDLYEEIPVVVMSADSHLCAAETLTADDLSGEVLIVPRDDVLGPLGLSTIEPSFAPLDTTADAIATVATGVGIAVVPQSLARLHRRKDVEQRPLAGGPELPVVLAWLRDRDAEDTQVFVGITRGRTSRSSR